MTVIGLADWPRNMNVGFMGAARILCFVHPYKSKIVQGRLSVPQKSISPSFMMPICGIRSIPQPMRSRKKHFDGTKFLSFAQKTRTLFIFAP